MWLEKLYRESLWMFYCNLYYIVTGSVTVLCQILYCLKNKASGDPAVHSGLRIWLPAAQVAMEPWVRSLAQQSELRICCCHAYGIDHSFGSYSVPGQGMSMCCRCSHKIKKKKKKKPEMVPGCWIKPCLLLFCTSMPLFLLFCTFYYYFYYFCWEHFFFLWKRIIFTL